MPLIDQSYFVGELNIPDTDKPTTLQRLNFFIAKYEEKLLRAVLGHALYEAYTAGIAGQAPDIKWTELQDGKTYTDVNGRSQRWDGFRKDATKQSMIAAYVYYWWLRDKATLTATIGEVAPQADNSSVRVSSAGKQAKAWNEMSAQVSELVRFLNANTAVYTQWEQERTRCVLDDFAPINELNL